MSKANGDGLDLTGTGAAYIRVSTDLQETERQYSAIRTFEKRYSVSIPKHHWFKDEGWARDKADTRPAFQQLLKLADVGAVKWIVVDALDRFGTKSAKQLMHYLYRLEEAGCRLFDVNGKDWTAEDDGTEITALIEGKKNAKEPKDKSHRVLGGKAEKARAGEWQGGAVRLGFDVACYHRETDKELWRVVFEGRDKRLKVFADGCTERFDGRDNFPKCQPMTEVLRIAPSNDKATLAAVVSAFKRFATESITFTALARYLNDLGFRNGCGGFFQHPQIEELLRDPAFIGFPTWNKNHFGKFHRFTGGKTVLEQNLAEKGSKNDPADWVQSAKRLFPPLVDLKTWNAVQDKLKIESKRTNAPRSAAQYLAGLVYCGNCGSRMVTGASRVPTKNPRKDGSTGERHEYFCGTYHKAARERSVKDCGCSRNGVFQDQLEPFVERYLEETGKRLQLLTEDTEGRHLTDRLAAQEGAAWTGFRDGIKKLTTYLVKHQREAYNVLLRDFAIPQEDGGPAPDEFVAAVVDCYQKNFDPKAVEAELGKLQSENERLTEAILNAKLPTKRAREVADARLNAIDQRMTELEQHRSDLGELVAGNYRQMNDLQLAIADAKLAMRGKNGERAMRQRAKALQSVIHKIECNFTATGATGGGWGKKNSKLTSVTIHPISGDSVQISTESKGTLLYSSAHSFMYRTRFGVMR